MAPNIFWASVARTLIGFGVGGVYVPAIKAFSQWFRKENFSFMIGLLMSVGNFGAVIATTPLAWSVDLWGWRITFYIIGGITLLLAFVALFFTHDKKEIETSHPSARDTAAEKSVFQIFIASRLWLIATIFLGIYGTALTFQGLWATPFLGVAIFQVVTHAILNRSECTTDLYPLSGFVEAFSVCVVIVVVCLVMSLFLKTIHTLLGSPYLK